MNNIEIRPVSPADAPFLTSLMSHPTLLHRLHQTATTLADWTEAIDLWLSDDDEEGYIVSDNGRPIGWFAFNALLTPKPYLKIAVLLPEYHSHGIGQTVLDQLLPPLKSRGYRSVGLFTDCDNYPAQACYRKCGFEIIAESEESWPDGTTLKQYEMEKTL